MKRKYLTVSALNNYIKHVLEHDSHLANLYVEGEISNFYLHQFSGHMYFTLKDDQSKIRCVMFRNDANRLRFKPENGMSVYLRGRVSLYVNNGHHQITVSEMEPSGIGSLHLAFEQLKEKLKKGNYFSEEFKRPLPKFPKKIAVITSKDGAVVKDIITTIEKRYPLVQLIIFPVNVQGKEAVPSIIKAFDLANQGDYDTIILARGGGSLEDLQSFNDESVAMAVFHSRIPVITGIGHETDTTICDYVSDLRAATPTAAAQFAVPSQSEVLQQFTFFQKEIERLTRHHFIKKEETLRRLATSRSFAYPLHTVRENVQRVDQLTDQLVNYMKQALYEKRLATLNLYQRLQRFHPSQALKMYKEQMKHLQVKLVRETRHRLKKKDHDLKLYIEKLSLLNPLEIMKRGYSITYSSDKKIIRSIHEVDQEERLYIQLQDGQVHCRVEEVVQNE